MARIPAEATEVRDLAQALAMLEQERSRREVAEAQLDRRYERLVDDISSNYLIYATDCRGDITYVSQSVERMLGYKPQDVIGRNWREFGDEGSPTFEQAEANEQALLTGVDSPPKLVELQNSDGARVLLEVQPRPLFDEEGVVIGVEGVCHDVSYLKGAEANERLIRDELEIRVRQRTAELEERIRFEALLVSLSTGFINLPIDQIDNGLNGALRRIGEFTGVDRCFIYQISPDNKTGSLTHEWCSPGTTAMKSKMQAIPVKQFEWEVEQLSAGRVFDFGDTSRVPPQAKGFAQAYKAFDIVSALNVPMISSGRLIGMLGLSTMQQQRRWTEEHKSLVQVLGQVLVNTIERHGAKTALLRSEARLRDIIRDQTEMIVRWAPDGRSSFANDAVCRFFGKGMDEVLLLNIFDNIHPGDLRQVKDKLAGLTPENPLAVDEHRMVCPDGSIAWYQWVDRALFDSHGELVEYQSVGRDITPLKRSQEQLEERLRFEQLVLGLSTKMINPHTDKRDEALQEALKSLGEFTEVDRAYFYLFDARFEYADLTHVWSGKSAPPVPKEVVRMYIKDLPWMMGAMSAGESVYVPTLDAMPPSAAAWREMFHAYGVKSFVNVPVQSEGTVIGFLGLISFTKEQHWTEDEISLLRLVGEILVSTLERGWAEKALEQSKERLRLTIEGVEEGVYDWNIQTGAVVVSDYWLRTLELPPGENTRSEDDWRERIHPDDWEGAEAALMDHFAGRTPIYEAEYRMRHADGHYSWNLNRGRVIVRSKSGRPLRMVGVDRDITDSVEAREKRELLKSQVAHLGRVSAMGETVAGIAHEVNQPLHAANTFNAASRRALNSGNTEKAEALSQKASEQITRAGDIIRRLREYTKPRRSEIVEVDLNDLARDSAEFVLGYNRQVAVTPSFDLEDGPLAVQGDPVQLQQVVVNLIQNSVDSIREACVRPARIRLATKREGPLAVLTITDNGKGSELVNPEEMFDAFFSTKEEGMGIGLSLCRTIMESHSGSIRASVNDSVGMTFTVSIPLIQTYEP